MFPPESSKATTHLDTFEFALGECVVTRTTKERYRFVQRVDEENVEVRDSKGEILRVQSSELRSAKEFGSVFFRTFRPEFMKKWRTLYSPSHESTSSNEKLEEEKEEDVAIHGYNVEQDVDLNDEFQKNGLPLSPDAFSGFSKGSTYCLRIYQSSALLYLGYDMDQQHDDDDTTLEHRYRQRATQCPCSCCNSVSARGFDSRIRK